MSVLRAHLSFVCCDWPQSWPGGTTPAHWRIFVLVLGETELPTHRWPARRRVIPTVTERAAALEDLGYQPEPGAAWEWLENPAPIGHGHPERVRLSASIPVVPVQGDLS